jgi:predicted DNA-binding protein YlxM (UPF0122 family)
MTPTATTTIPGARAWRRATARYQAAVTDRDQAITTAAVDHDFSAIEIARQFGITRERVYQILERRS